MSLTTKSFALLGMLLGLAMTILVACGDNPEVVVPLEPAVNESPDASTNDADDDADASTPPPSD